MSMCVCSNDINVVHFREVSQGVTRPKDGAGSLLWDCATAFVPLVGLRKMHAPAKQCVVSQTEKKRHVGLCPWVD